MKGFFKILVDNSEARKLLVFHFLFFGGMSISKIAHPLWFDQNNALVSYGFSYSAMAIVGAFSFIQGYFSIKIGIRKTVIAGLILYSLGMFLRIFTTPSLAIIAGVIAGIGASTAIVCIRPWLMYFSKEDEHSKAMALHNFGTNTGTALGNLIVSIILIFISTYYFGFKAILIFAAVFPLLAILVLPSKKIDLEIRESNEKNSNKLGFFQIFKQYKTLTIGVLFFGSLSGLIISILSPFFPVILKDIGFSVSSIGIIITSMLIIRIILDPLLSDFVNAKNKQIIFFIAELMFGVLTLTLILDINIWILLIVLYIRTIALGISFFTEGVIQMGIYPKVFSGMLFGLSQSAYWVGDSIGGTIGAVVYQNAGVEILVLISTILIISNAILFPIFSLIIQKNKKGVDIDASAISGIN